MVRGLGRSAATAYDAPALRTIAVTDAQELDAVDQHGHDLPALRAQLPAIEDRLRRAVPPFEARARVRVGATRVRGRVGAGWSVAVVLQAVRKADERGGRRTREPQARRISRTLRSW
jgi:hypothetical protein